MATPVSSSTVLVSSSLRTSARTSYVPGRLANHDFSTCRFGVGELSAINGIAGAFSEMVPVLHIAGVPSTSQQKTKPMLHHTLGDGRFDAYAKAAEQVTASQAILMNKSNAASEIDRVLTDCITLVRTLLCL